MANAAERVRVTPVVAKSYTSSGKKTDVATTAKYSPHRASNHNPTPPISSSSAYAARTNTSRVSVDGLVASVGPTSDHRHDTFSAIPPATVGLSFTKSRNSQFRRLPALRRVLLRRGYVAAELVRDPRRSQVRWASR